uniref:LRP chaperone MESD n=1 Tax=Ciona intestinalis TaxID=7719 RepID=F6PK60_CIOIN|nr:LRP chaperone MESD-like [Ciona intestinalis]|eukprot:XP_002131502.1 LRP chaperone MESD-like [Ciona intestinalis]
MKLRVSFLLFCIICNCLLVTSKKKDPRDFTDADIYKLEEEWTEEGDIDEGDLPEHLRKSEPIDMTKISPDDPEGIVKMSKRHKTLMMFVTVSGNPDEAETEDITKLWQSMLFNANIEVTRFVISANRVLFKLNDGSYAYEIRDFLIEQERCETVTIEGKDYPGKGSPIKKGSKKKDEKKKNDKNKSKKKKKNKTEL